MLNGARPFGRAISALARRPLGAALKRSLIVPHGKIALGVGGGTFGGSGKTPLAMACAEFLAAKGARVAFVGHAYRASPGRARVVDPDDSLDLVGDEALVAARAFAALPRGARPAVVVAESRQSAIFAASEWADVLVLDGVLQTKTRLRASLLAVDVEAPWGNGYLPPCGDMRAAPEALLAATDVVVPVGPETDLPPAARAATRSFSGVVEQGAVRPLSGWMSAWMSARLGLVTFLAHPERLVRQLERAGVVPVATHFGGDHGSSALAALERIAKETPVDAWLCSAKCALHLPSIVAGRPVLVLGDSVRLSPSLCDWISHVIRRTS